MISARMKEAHGQRPVRVADVRFAEPSEARFRTLALGALALFGPPLLLFIYLQVMFKGLINPDALDFAQIGRNVATGHGFTTLILRPLALTHGNNPLHQPDVTHGPLFPLLLASAFAALGAKDSVAAGVSGLFYLLTIPVLFRLAAGLFSRQTAWIATAIFTLNALTLEYAISGLDLTLIIFLTTCLLFAFMRLAQASQQAPDGQRPPKLWLAIAGAIAGLLYLTDPIFIWFAPPLLLAIVILFPRHRMAAAGAFAWPLLVVSVPWMIRNATLAGNPIFGLRGMELWMYTKGHYPGLTAYRQSPGDLTPGVGLYKAVVQKMLLSVGSVIQNFPQVTASWVLAFLLPSLLFRFSDPAANAVRRIMMWCFLGLFFGMLLFGLHMPLFVSLIPAMLVFSVAYLLYLVEQAHLPRLNRLSAATLIGVAIVFPLLSAMTIDDSAKPERLKDIDTAAALGKAAAPAEVVVSDQPWLVAWHARRPSLWVPVSPANLSALRDRMPGTRWLMLTDRTPAIAPEWEQVYGLFLRWSQTYAQATANKTQPPAGFEIKANGNPAANALAGFVPVAPVEPANPTAILATVRGSDTRVGSQ